MKRYMFSTVLVFLSVSIFSASCSKEKNTGTISFWTDYNVGSQIQIIVFKQTSTDGETRYLDQYYLSGVPDCSSGGTAQFSLPGGTYHYVATASGYRWTGTITMKNKDCQLIKL